MSEKIKLELRYWDDGGVVWTKGQHTVEDFCDTAHRVFGDIDIPPGSVRNAYARLCGVFEDGAFAGHYLDYPVEPKRGAFLITYTEEFECADDVFDEYGLWCGG